MIITFVSSTCKVNSETSKAHLFFLSSRSNTTSVCLDFSGDLWSPLNRRLKMDARRIRKQQPSPASTHDQESEGACRAESEERPSLLFQRPTIILATFTLMLLPFIIVLSNRSPSWDMLCKAGRVEGTGGFESKLKQGTLSSIFLQTYCPLFFFGQILVKMLAVFSFEFVAFRESKP